MIIDNSKLGDSVKLIRASRGFTQSTLAEHSNLTPNTVARLERGEIQFTVKTINAISTALGVPASFLTILATDCGSDSTISGLVRSLQKSVKAIVTAETSVS